MSEISQNDILHQKMLYPTVRVRTSRAGGSGTVIYCKPSTNDPNDFHTYVLTCYHVIQDNISIRDDWDPSIGQQIKKEYRQPVTVEFFEYNEGDVVDRTFTIDGDIMTYDASHDLAIIKCKTRRQYPYVATLYPHGKENELLIGSHVYYIGSSLGHDPLVTTGILTHKGDIIDHKDYYMASTPLIYGNSGGSAFTDDGLFIGVPSRIDIASWGVPVTHCNYFTPIHRVYKFFDESLFHFLYDSTHSEERCEKEREERKKQEEIKALLTARAKEVNVSPRE